MNEELDLWKPYPMYCPNCRNRVVGSRNSEGHIKAVCSKCGTVLVRIDKSRRHSTIEIYAPEQQNAV